MAKVNRLCAMFMVSVLAAGVGGCSFLPEEEAYPAAPVMQSYEMITYEQTPVLRGDLILEEKITCRYVANVKESAAFSYTGEKIDGIYVEEGQEVKAGELLAALEDNGLREQILEQEYLIKALHLKQEHLKQDQELEKKQLDAWETQGTQEYKEALGALLRRYELAQQELEDSLYIEGRKLSQMQKESQDRKLYAGIGGTVLYVQKMTAGQTSVTGETIAVIADMSTNAFTVTGKDAQYFPVGTECTIEINKQPYEAVSVEASAIGITEETDDETAYLQLVIPDPTLENGDKGTVTVVLEERQDTLYVDKYAVHTAEGRQFVYILNEEGLRVMQDVTCGLEVKNYIEITGGLSEGDSVIMD